MIENRQFSEINNVMNDDSSALLMDQSTQNRFKARNISHKNVISSELGETVNQPDDPALVSSQNMGD